MPQPDIDKELLLLIRRYVDGKATAAERAWVEQYYDYFDHRPDQIASLSQEQAHQISEEMKAAIAQRIVSASVIPVRRRRWLRVAAAAVLLLGGGFLFHQLQQRPEKMEITGHEQAGTGDVLPGGSRATLTLDNGTVVVLDSISNGRIADQGSTTILKTGEGQLAYDAVDGDNLPGSFNILTTPRGGQYKVTLPDGSHVWLNAASSLRYPTAFSRNQRLVELTGEAYFEVAKDETRPFRVRVDNNTLVQVFGTHFNVNAYTDEPAVVTTLLEGAVKVSTRQEERLLYPGDQAEVKANLIRLNNQVDVGTVVAWKNGTFQFAGTSLASVMRQLARWYDVEVVYEGQPADLHFDGMISRHKTLGEVLQVLEKTGVRFRLEGKKIIVTP